MKFLSLLALVGSMALLPTSVPLALAQGTYTQIDYPGAVQTLGSGIDEAGDIVGYYTDASNNAHGFLLSGGVFAAIDYPGATSTTLHGINDLGQIVGYTINPYIGFLYDVASQTFTTIGCPEGTTWPEAINDAGMIAGNIISPKNQRDQVNGFVLAGSRCSYIAPPGTTSGSYVYVYGISASAEVPGDLQTNGNDNFLFHHGKYEPLAILNNGTFPDADVLGINGAGTELVGVYNPSPASNAGFLYQNRTLQAIQFPGSIDSLANGINNAGEVVGYFIDASGTRHGFTWTPPADAGKK